MAGILKYHEWRCDRVPTFPGKRSKRRHMDSVTGMRTFQVKVKEVVILVAVYLDMLGECFSIRVSWQSWMCMNCGKIGGFLMIQLFIISNPCSESNFSDFECFICMLSVIDKQQKNATKS